MITRKDSDLQEELIAIADRLKELRDTKRMGDDDVYFLSVAINNLEKFEGYYSLSKEEEENLLVDIAYQDHKDSLTEL